ncbi:MAG TPA: GNAT family N-acetyltransferase, partial [Bryobacteraceae bacterium]|nr:GNAT family N-acetyltransferase [Bryobacteraceae bacterium]
MTQPPPIIRPIREADLPAYKALRLEALQAHPEAYGSDYADQAGDPDSVWMGRIQSSLEGKWSRIFLAEDSGEMAGLLAAYREKGAKVCHSATLVSVYVRPRWRGRGLADQMVQEAIAWSASAGVRILRLTVVTSNTRAIRCYQRCGFRVCGIQPEVIRVGTQYHDELLMW